MFAVMRKAHRWMIQEDYRMDKANILVVDDEPVLLEGLRRILEGDLYTVESCTSGRTALDLLQKKDFDMVITDLKMPGMSGLEVLKAIKILQPEMPVIIITGYFTADAAVDAMKYGAIDFILKPFSPDQLREKVARAFEQKPIHTNDIYLRKELRDHLGSKIFVGESDEMQKISIRDLQMKPNDSTVLIAGESDTGVHQCSSDAAGKPK
jgi:DNA-binding NtrC family response regulator